MNNIFNAIDFELLKISWWMQIVLLFVPSEKVSMDEGWLRIKKFRGVSYIVGESK